MSVFRHRAAWVAGVAGLAFLVRIPFLGVPVDRDLGAQAYVARAWKNGQLPYRDIFHEKPPGIYLVYRAGWAVFGDSPASTMLMGAFCSAASSALVAVMGARLFGPAAGAGAGALYAVWSGGPAIEGWAPNTETFMTVFVLASLLLAWRGLPLTAGIALGAAGLMRQTGLAVFPAVLVVAVLLAGGGWRAALRLTGGVVLPWIGMAGYFASRGDLAAFWDGVLWYNLMYYIPDLRVEPWDWFRGNFTMVFSEAPAAWAAGLIGFLLALVGSRSTRGRERRVLALWFLCAVIGVMAGRRYFKHYFLQVLPPLALLAVAALRAVPSRPIRWAAAAAVAILLPPGLMPKAYVRESGEQLSARAFGTTVFSASLQAAEVIRRSTRTGDTVYVWGMEPEIYYLAERRCSSRYIFTYHAQALLPNDAAVWREASRDRPKVVISLGPSSNADWFAALDGYRLSEEIRFVDSMEDTGPAWTTMRLYRRRA